LVAFLVSVGVDDGFETVRVEVAVQRVVGALKIESAGDQRVELNQAAGHHVYACRPGVGIAEDARHGDLEVLNVLDGQRHLGRTETHQYGGAGRTYCLDARHYRVRRPTGVNEGVDVQAGVGDIGLARINYAGAAVLQRSLPSLGHQIGDDDLRSAKGPGGLGANDPDRSRAGDQDARPRGHTCLTHCGNSYRERL
jgi:hypothetical protein